ncbi:TetR family transcriptional regulator C-terminal domain-containing protein [Chachezhania sediminis]|uniref:TetR family transcriptional regulator C-terminal domain-containing protein n=1 Tax=Chachezhania sediminis TaxID=2599291 RepID=UPI001E59EAC6|nr:TetR family transcriptional regulator C-terminal domain-containing protein [Chachezhania sediminis]
MIERRRSLLEAAVKVIAEKGLTGVTVNSIAREANCSFGVVSFHFQSKEGIIFAALDHAAAEYETYLDQLRLTAAGPADRVRSMIDVDFSGKAGGRTLIALWLAFWAEAVRVPSYRDRCAVLRDHFNQMVEEDLKQLADDRGLKVDAAQVAMSLNALISGLWIESTLGGGTMAEMRKRGHEACIAFLRLHFPDDF